MVLSTGPCTTCALVMNLYIGLGSECSPCYAMLGGRTPLGNAFEERMGFILQKNDRHRQVTVDSNEKYHVCTLRYL